MKNLTGQKVIAIMMRGSKKILMALAVVSAVLFVLWGTKLFFAKIPLWVRWEKSAFTDKTGNYEIVLRHKKVCVKYDTNVIWRSQKEIKVQKALSCDIDNDGTEELILLCWKIGRFGKHKPFWITNDEDTWSQHLFVYEYEAEQIRPKWMSSYLGQNIADMKFNGKEAPNVRLWMQEPDGTMSSWVWDFWGFEREEEKISFCVFGDVLAHKPIYNYGLQKEPSFGFLFENVQQIVDDSTVAVINQETPLTDNPAMYGDFPRFGTPVQVGRAIVNAGFDVVTCATNHALDRGVEGVDFTKKFFESNDIKCLGIQTSEEEKRNPYTMITRNGVRFALLNFTYGTNGISIPENFPNMVHLFSEKEVRSALTQARSEADFVIVFAHWGTEYAPEPDAFQKQWTQIFLECEVDIVVGTHPHCLQPYEVLVDDNGHRMLVYYSIGNYISAQPEKECVKGGAAQFTIELTPTGYQLTAYALQPLVITWHKGGKYTVQCLIEKENEKGNDK